MSFVQLFLKSVDGRKQFIRGTEYMFTIRCERKSGWPAVTQLQVQTCLEIRNMLADSGSANIEFEFSRSETTAGHDSPEHLEQADIDIRETGYR
nr:hypothetical protein [Roseovarius albus]